MLITIETVLGLLAGVAALALLSRKLPSVPFPVLLVLGGLILGVIPGLPVVSLNPELVFFLFLPALLYPAALFTSWRDFRANLRPILLLAVGLVLFTTAATGFLLHYFIPELPLAAGFVLGAIVSPPDAIAAMAVAEHLRLPRRLVTIIEGESLVNDATALVAVRFAVAAAGTGLFSVGQATLQFFFVAIGGVALGLFVGFITGWIQKRIEDPPIEITISLLTPFAAYLPAEKAGVSGVLAVVAAGLYHGWQLPNITSSRTRLQAGPVWRMVEFLLQGFIFLLIGLQLPDVLRQVSDRSPLQLIWYALLISVAVILIRILWVFPAAYVPRLLWPKLCERDPFPAWQNVALISWTGMRGVVSLAAALALPYELKNGAPFPGRDLILVLTFVVILATLVFQGLSLPAVIRWLAIKEDRSGDNEERHARLVANRSALARIEELVSSKDSSRFGLESAQRLRIEYEDRIRQLERTESTGVREWKGLFSSDYDVLSREALQIERKAILKLRDDLVINDEALRKIQRDIDLAEARLGEQGPELSARQV